MTTYPEPPPTPIIPTPEQPPEPNRVRRVLLIIAWLAAGLYGLGLLVLAFTVGNCAAFGGRCGDNPPPILDDDVFGMAFAGVLFMAAGPAISHWRRRRQFWVAPAALVAAVVIGLVARSSGY